MILQDIYKPTVLKTKIVHAEVIAMLSGKSLRIPEERATQIRIGLHGTTVLIVRRNESTTETRKKIIRAVGTLQ